MKILIDTDILLDVALDRSQFAEASGQILGGRLSSHHRAVVHGRLHRYPKRERLSTITDLGGVSGTIPERLGGVISINRGRDFRSLRRFVQNGLTVHKTSEVCPNLLR
jgi:hypothetical protein